MAAQLPKIVVTVVDDSGNSLQGATVTLTGGDNPQVLATDANGRCTFPNLPAGQYRLLIAREGFNTRAASVTLTDAADESQSERRNVWSDSDHSFLTVHQPGVELFRPR